MSSDNAMDLFLYVLFFVFGGVVGACLKYEGRELHDPLPVEVPAGLAVDATDWGFSPTGGYIHINYKLKEDTK